MANENLDQTQSLFQEKFLFDTEYLLTFCASFSNVDIQDQTDSMLETKLNDLDSRWKKLESSYENVMIAPGSAISKEIKDEARENFNACSEAFYACKSNIVDGLKIWRTNPTVRNSSTRMSLSSPPVLNQNSDIQIKLPPCDTEIFEGSYEKWPSFRDMFTAIYINGTSCPPVVKLFHLRNKTQKEAGTIVKRYPLCDDSFSLAWNALKARYENKRVLVDHQLQILFNIPVAMSEDSKTLQRIHSTVSDVLQTLRTLDVNTENCDFFIVYLVCSKLPNETLALWEQSLKSHRELQTWSALEDFLIDRYEAVERISNMKLTRDRQNQQLVSKSSIQSYASQEKLNSLCKVCSENHSLRMCQNFKKFSVQQRIDFVMANRMCMNCLSPNHLKAKCPSKHTCFVCKLNHHTSLHLFKPQMSQGQGEQVKNSTSGSNKFNRNTTSSEKTLNDDLLNPRPSTSAQARKLQIQANVSVNTELILLRTAMVQIEHMGEYFTIRALIDPGSQRTFLSERIRNRLQLPTRRSAVDVIGIGGQVQSASKECSLCLFARKSNVKFSINAIILPRVTRHIPSISFKVPQSELDTLDLADPTFNQSSPIDLILGNDSERFINIDGVKKNICGLTSAYNTVFGWVLSGPINGQPTYSLTTSVAPSENSILNELLKKFWEQEELPSLKHKTEEDQYCETFYSQTTTREADGRYVVRLPFKNEFPDSIFLSSSRMVALGQYSRMQKSLAKDQDLQIQYNSVLNEYISLAQMEKTSSREICADGKYFSFYLPHHAVVKPEHKTTKVRVVFNASCKSKSGYSLNDVLYTGPTLQQDLMNVILNWRKYRFVFNGDIQKMYRQILVHPDDRSYQKIIFQNEKTSAFQDYELKTVTFGVNCAPFLAIRTLLQLAHDSEKEFPRAAHILRHETYVDDILSGGHSLKDTVQSQFELIHVLRSAGFPLKKICSNNSQLLSKIPAEDLYDSDFLKFQETSTTKTLGIKWNAIADSFSYTFLPPPSPTKITKRSILSTVAKLFDPAGWVNPVIIRAKMLMQQLWLEGLEWDQTVSSDSLSKWYNILSDLAHVEEITIPRWIQYTPSDIVEIHGFSDASKQAYCACVYIRCEKKDRICTNLIAAKSKVAPLQTVCLPRLELNGAVLLAKLVNHILQYLNLNESEIILWTDSTIVLSWLSKPPATWETYVANRIAEIHRLVPKSKWRHVPTADNPADIGTRGCTVQDLIAKSLWWHGPLWLVNPKSGWPEKNHVPVTQFSLASTIETGTVSDILDNFSSYQRALRVVSYMFRFVNKSLHRPNPDINSIKLAHSEVSFVKHRLIILAQISKYESEYTLLSNAKPIGNKSPLINLNPFLDSNKILRVNGRLSESSLSYNERHPVILPGNSRLCHLYLTYLHITLAHAECNQMCRMTQTEFYISRLKSRIKKVIRHCKTCIIFKQKVCSQIMAPLPPDRCTLSAPFQICGIDFAGPFEVKTSSLRNAPYIKGYVSVFVCFSTKAVHLEACSDLSTGAFIAAFSRFIGRRGLPHKIVSDNGRNFVGASRKLHREFTSFIKSASEEVSQKYVTQGFQWSFIPPHAPHMGGLWEAAVKSFKYHFKRLAGSHKFTFEEFSTVLSRIEGILNSRPISAMSNDPTDITALTPGHFLIGKPIMAFPEPPITKLSVVNRWEKIKALHLQFALRWKEEYLKALQKRYKWKSSSKNVRSGDLVIVIDNLLPPSEWRLGRIINAHIGSDDNVRVATVRTASGDIIRPIVKLCPLPILEHETD